MAHMATNPLFAHADPNTYKRRFQKWGFTVKNHVFSNIQSAIRARQRCLERGEEFRGFERLGYKTVSDKDIERYARRKRMKVDKGKLVPRAPAISHLRNSIPSTRGVGNIDLLTDAQAEPAVPLPLEGVATERYSATPAAQPTGLATPLQENSPSRQCLYLLDCQKRCCLPCECWTSIRTADPMAPDIHRGPENIFSAYKYSLQSLYLAGNWCINEYDHVQGTGEGRLDVDVCGFHNFFLEVSRLYQAGDVYRARQIFEKALCLFSQYLIRCLPRAVNALQYTIFRLLDHGRVDFLGWILKCVSKMICQSSSNSALRSLFSNICGLEPNSLRDVVLRFCDIQSDFSESLYDHCTYAHFYPRLLKISSNDMIDENLKREKIFSMLDTVNHDTIQGQAATIACWGWMVKENLFFSKVDLVRDLIEKIRCLAETQLLDDYIYVWAISEASRFLSSRLRDTGRIKEAIDAQEYSIDLVKTIGGRPSIQQFRVLRNLRKSIGDDHAAAICAADIEQAIDEMVKLDIK